MKFVNGLHTDNHPADQPEGTYRDARNVIINEKRGAISNEPGIVSTSLLPEDYHPIGHVVLPDNRIIVFSATQDGRSEIGVIQIDGNYETLVNDPRLNFSLDHPIHAVARLGLQRELSQQYSMPVEVSTSEEPIVIHEDITLSVDDPASPSPSPSP